MTDSERTGTWIDVAGAEELRRRRKIVVPHGDGEILVLMHEGAAYAFDNTCIHRQRPLVKGVVLNGRLVCPGHQWAFDLATGCESVKGECQPTYAVKVEGGRVLVDPGSRSRRGDAGTNG
ncbi:MAG TPA: Rieske (2Fe-2S) protein [Acidimicrobiales bacterium]